jgi:ribosome-binding protein aMBF1 (putative translation factor)
MAARSSVVGGLLASAVATAPKQTTDSRDAHSSRRNMDAMMAAESVGSNTGRVLSREICERLGLTRRQLAIKLDVTESTIERWETSKTGIPDERKLELAQVLDVKPSQLVGWE